MLEQARLVLKDTFGYDSFRPLQEEIIANVTAGNDTLVIMPTGGGKSICYQVPALLFDGLTLVVSPLISLMMDQVEQLKALDVPAAVLNSSLSAVEYERNVAMVLQGSAKMLYVAPETLFRQRTLDILSSLRVACLTIDEAHCISEWGHDFRPEYRRLAKLRGRFPQAVCMALTATATPRVQEDIKESLGFSASNEFIASFDRANLFLQVADKGAATRQTLDFLRERRDQSGIIYCFSRRQVEELAEDLSAAGFSVRPYHAGLGDDERRSNQEMFIRDEIQIVVATIAFGMGINKPNVRFVVHYDLPKNIEGYYQEIGRAGRDGLRAECLLLYTPADAQKIRYFIAQKEEDEQRVANLHLAAMMNYAETGLCRRQPLLQHFGESYDKESCDMCDNCLSEERADLVDLSEAAQKFLSCVKRCREKFGAAHIIDVLRGSNAKKVLDFRHHLLSTYGIGKEYSKRQWQHLARQFLQQGLLQQDLAYGALQVTRKGYEVLLNGASVMGQLEAAEPTIARPKGATPDYDPALFELLRDLRKVMARRDRVPPYIIFNDKTLAEMAAGFPQSPESMQRVGGVGQAKWRRYGEAFLTQIRRYCEERGIEDRLAAPRPERRRERRAAPKKRRHHLIAEAYLAGVAPRQLAADNNIRIDTVINHLYAYAAEGNRLPADGILALSQLSAEEQASVMDVFERLGADLLRPAFEELGESVSYHELRIMQLYFVLQ